MRQLTAPKAMRLAIALSLIVWIASQIPMRDGVAVADCYGTGCGGGGGNGRTLIQATSFALVGYGLYSVLSGAGASAISVPSGSSAPSGPDNTTTSPEGAAGAAPVFKPAYDTARDNEDFSSFAKLADAADLKETLREKGPYTAFLPSNTTINTLGADRLQALLKPENKAELARLIRAHIVRGSFTIDDLRIAAQRAGVAGVKLDTLTGGKVSVTFSDSEGLRIDGVMILQSDIACSNGVLHPIGAVLDAQTP